MVATRKTSRATEVIVKKDENLEVPILYYNHRYYKELENQVLESPELEQVISLLPPAYYFLKIKGGGVGSKNEVAFKKLYSLLSPKSKKIIKYKYNYFLKTDLRRVLPKKAGGKARARHQKSYR